MPNLLEQINEFNFQDPSFISFLKRIPAAVAVLDTEIKYIAVSDRWYSDYGITDLDIIGKSHYEIFPEILNMPEWLAFHQSSLKGAVHEKEEDCFPREDGGLQWIRWKIYPWYNSKKEIGGMIFYTEEITQSKERQLSLERANQKLSATLEEIQRKNAQLEDFAHITAHNLRAPATNLIALTQLYTGANSQDQKEKIVSQIDLASQHLVETLDQLQKALIIRTNTDMENQTLVFEEIVSSTRDQVSTLLDECQAEVHTNFVEAPNIEYPKTYLESIFINLLSNAIKYRSPQRRLKVHIRTYVEKDQIHLKVEDNGLGIDLVRHGSKMFKMGKTFHASKDSRGMGLFMIKTQIEALKGEIKVESTVDQGSTFTVIF